MDIRISMSNKFRVISMYTPNTPYEEEIKELQKSCEKFKLRYKFYAIENSGDWVKNTQQKANVIKAALQEFAEDVIWLDADAEVLQEPKLFAELADATNFHISVYRASYAKQKNKATSIREAVSLFLKRRRYPHGEIISGTVYLKNCAETKKLVQEWIELNNQKVEWDQRTLQEILDMEDSPYLVRQLPPEYIKIVPRGRSLADIKNTKTVIGQKQLSRSAKKFVNKA